MCCRVDKQGKRLRVTSAVARRVLHLFPLLLRALIASSVLPRYTWLSPQDYYIACAFRFISSRHLRVRVASVVLTAPVRAAPYRASGPGRHATLARRVSERLRPRVPRARSARSHPTCHVRPFPRGRRSPTSPAARPSPVTARQRARSAALGRSGARAWSTKTSESLTVVVSFSDPVFRSATTCELRARQHGARDAGAADLPVREVALPERERAAGNGHVQQPVCDRACRVLVDADDRVVGDDLERLRRLRAARC
jgi:hypothetical protein